MVMTVFDDGNTRHVCPGTQNSRGMVLLVDEAARQIYIETAADLGGYSLCAWKRAAPDPRRRQYLRQLRQRYSAGGNHPG